MSWQETSVPHHMALSIELLEFPHHKAADFPQAKPSKLEKGRRHSIFYDLVLKVPHRSAVFSIRGNQQELEYQVGAILEANHHTRRTGKGIDIY